jgi:hypothetical protein
MQHFKTIAFALVALASVSAQAAPPAALPPEEAYGYTRYELLAPGSGKFRIIYDITETRPGATAFFNPIRKGSVSTDESVIDRATGSPLAFKVVSGADAKTEMPGLDPTYDYIRVALARPVPADGGEDRIRILKTYEDKKSYTQTGDTIVFDRSLGIKRNAVVLPKGYGLVACNYPSQVEQEADGRIKVSFLNNTPGEAPLKLTAKPMNLTAGPSSVAKRLGERAAQTRTIVYFLRDPDTHLRPLSRLYGRARRHESLHQCRAHGQRRRQPFGAQSRHGRSDPRADTERRRNRQGRHHRSGFAVSHHGGFRDCRLPFRAAEGRPIDPPAHVGNLHRSRPLQARRRRTRLRPVVWSSDEHRRAPVRLATHELHNPRASEHAAGRTGAARFRQCATG